MALLLLHILLLSALSLLLLKPRLIRCLLRLDSLGTVVLAHGLQYWLLLLRLDDGDAVWQTLRRACFALWIATTHDLDLDAKHALSKQHVTSRLVDKVLRWLTGVDHEAVLEQLLDRFPNPSLDLTYGELHALRASSPELSANDNLATLGTALHDKPQHTIARPPHSQTVQQLVPQALTLCDSAETSVLNLGSVEGDAVLGELEALLDERRELANATALLAEDFLCVGSADDDVGNSRGDADFDAGVSLLSEFALEEFVQLGIEDTVYRQPKLVYV